MNKEEFLKRFKEEKLYIGPYIMVFDQITDEPQIIGCVYEEGIWKVFETRERGGHFIVDECETEEEAFEILYELVKIMHNAYNKNQ